MGRSWFIGSKVMNSGVTSLPFYKDCFSDINSYHTLGCFHENIHFSLVKTSRYLCKRVSPCTKFFSLKSNQSLENVLAACKHMLCLQDNYNCVVTLWKYFDVLEHTSVVFRMRYTFRHTLPHPLRQRPFVHFTCIFEEK